MRKKNKPIYAFIDANNINLGTISEGWSLDWGKFRLFLANKYKVEKAFFFIGYIKSNRKLYKKLEKIGFTIIFKRVGIFKERKRIRYKGNIDAELVLHTMIQLDNFSSAIIASGDGDFYCLAEYLGQNQKLNKILVPNMKFSEFLLDFSPKIVNLQKVQMRLKRKVTKIRSRSKP